MKYWPVNAFLNHRRTPMGCRLELLNVAGLRLSEESLVACHQLSMTIPACTSLALICSEGAPTRRVYLKHPTMENWLQIERGGFIDTGEGFGFLMDALH